MSLPPGPQSSPWLQVKGFLKNPLQNLEKLNQEYGDIFTIRIPGGRNYVVVSNPDHIKQVFQKDADHFDMEELNQGLKPIVGRHSLFVMDSHRHQKVRKLIMPAFHGPQLIQFGEVMMETTKRKLFGNLEHPEKLNRLLVSDFARDVALDIIIQVVFGAKSEAQFTRLKDLLTSELNVLAKWPSLLFPFTQINLGPLSPWGRFLRESKKVNQYLLQEIRRRKESIDPTRNSILDSLIAAKDEDGGSMSDEEIHDHLITLLMAGHETTTASLTWAVRWIYCDLPLLQDLKNELSSATLPNGELDAEKVEHLPLLEAAIRETLRILPVIPILGRQLKKAISIDQYELPEKTGIALAIYLTHRRESLFPNPGRFNPKNFLNTKVTPFQWFPFGGGTRRCIGYYFALYQLKMMLATLIRYSEMKLVPEQDLTEVRRGMTLLPKSGVQVEAILA